MIKFLKYILKIILFYFFTTTYIYADSCSAPTDTVTINSILNNQNIDRPFIVDTGEGDSFFYKIVIPSDGRLVINTAIDTYSSDNALDTVNTYGFLLKSDCSSFDSTSDGMVISTEPRLFKIDKILTAGTYYLRVRNEVEPGDVNTDLAKGFFQIENSFTKIEAGIKITKDAPDTVIEGEIFNFHLSIENNGTGVVDKNVTVTDHVSSDFDIVTLTYDTSVWKNCIYDSNKSLSCELINDLLPGESRYFDITVETVGTAGVESVWYSAYVYADTEFGTINDSDDKKVIIVADNPYMELSKTVNKSVVSVGEESFYTLDVYNSGNVPLTGINIVDTIPSELTITLAYGTGWDCSGSDISNSIVDCTLASLDVNESRSLYIDFKANSASNGVVNSAKATSNEGTTSDDNVSLDILPATYGVKITKEVSVPIINSSDIFSYILTVDNNGSDPISDIVVKDSIDPNLALVSEWNSNTAPWSCTNSGNDITCNYSGSLKSGEKAKDIYIKVQAPETSIDMNIDNSATVDAKTDSNISVSDDVLKSITVQGKEIIDADLEVEISDSSDPVDTDTIYFYNVVVTNHNLTKNVQNLILDINTTSSDDYILIDYSDISDWSCQKTGKNLHCELKHDLFADTNETLRVNVKSPNKITTVKVNATLYSKYVNDTNLANNSVNEDTVIKQKDLSGSNTREFTKVPLLGMIDMNIFGDILTIGNQSICQKSSSGNCQEPSYGFNDWVTQRYVNLDIVYAGGYKTATKAKLEIDPTDEILWAGLYWMGRIDKGITGYKTKMDNAHKVYIRADSNTSGYVEVQAQRSADAVDNSGNTIIVDKFNFINSDSYFDYQGVADVTSYVKANRGGDYWVADIQSSEGDNLSAGWNLVVIVQDTKLDPTRELKNITVFDGYQGVWKSPDYMTDSYPDEVNQTVSGFLTPAAGPIKSKVIFFSFEGDKTLSDFIKVSDSTGTMHYLSNAKNPADDVMNGTISKNGVTVVDRAPNLENTSGIDVDEFDLGDISGTMGTGIIDNSQTSAKISIGSLPMASNGGGGDRFYLGMFAFSTNLNDPVCYMQKLKNASFTADLGSSVNLGEMIGIEVEFKNKEIQTLKNLHGHSQIDEIFREDNSTFELKNLGEATFTTQNSLFEFGVIDTGDANLTEVTTSIGAGATSSSGGELKTGESVFIRFNAIIDGLTDDNLTNNRYSVSYDPTPNKKIMVKRCSGDDQKLEIIDNHTNGFEITHQNGLTDGINDGLENGDPTKLSNENHLFTQVVDQDFNIDVVVLDDENGTKTRVASDIYKGLLQIEVVEYDKGIVDTSTDPCRDFVSISDPFYVAINDDIRESTTLHVPDASKHAAIRVRYLVDAYNRHATWNTAANTLTQMQNMLLNSYYKDKRCEDVCIDIADESACRSCIFKDRELFGGLSISSCSTDVFAIKPREIDMDIDATQLVGGRDYTLHFDSNTTAYEHNITAGVNGLLEYNLTNPGTCTATMNGALLTASQKIEFINGEANLSNFSYDNIGDIDISFLDRGWTLYDQNSSDANMSDCIIGSSDNIPDINGKIGCDISGERGFSFSPSRFNSSIVSFSDFSNDFTYISNVKDHSAPVVFKIEAVLDDNSSVATNFSSGCYASDINYTVSLDGFTHTPLFFDLNNSIMDNNPTTGNFTTTEGNFTNGEATIKIGLNINRRVNKPINPFIINSKDINISVDDNGTYGISGRGVSSAVDVNTTFYYGRCHVPNIKTEFSDINITFQYEVYCDGCDKSKFVIANGAESEDSVLWYINNDNHIFAKQGDFIVTKINNGTTIANKTFKGVSASLGTLKAPHSDRIYFKPSPWLIYNKFDQNADIDSFNIIFSSSSNVWAGKGDIGTTVDSNISKKILKKMEW